MPDDTPPPTDRAATNQPSETPKLDDRFRVLSDKTLRALTIFSFVAQCALLATAMAIPDRFYHPISRFAFCAFASITAGLFFFVLYPTDYQLDNIPGIENYIKLGRKIAGPIALVLLLFAASIRYMPQPPAFRVFELNFPPNQVPLTSLVKFDPEGPVLLDENLAKRVLVEFPNGERTRDIRLIWETHPQGKRESTLQLENGTTVGRAEVKWSE